VTIRPAAVKINYKLFFWQ